VACSSTPGSRWPSRISNFAAAIFIGASGTTNVVYGFGKGDTLATSLVWAGVAGAVAIVFALAWPALIRSVDAKRWSAALIALVAMLLSGAYSVTAALGSAAGGRANAAATETATTDARNKAQAAYDTAKAELDTLAGTKPAAEIQALIAAAQAELAKLPAGRSVAEVEAVLRGAQRDPQRYGCAMINGSMALSCPKLDGELARARQRERLGAKVASLVEDAGRSEQRLQGQRTASRAAMDKASADLASIQPARIANSDAKALTRYLGALGLEVGPDRLNDLLILLAVVMIEAGGGLALALGMALSGPSGRPVEASPDTPASEPVQARTAPTAAPDAPPAKAAANSDVVATGRRTLAPVTTLAGEILDRLQVSGGRTEGVRHLAIQLGRARSTVSDECHRLSAAGHLKMTRGPQGMVLTLAARPN
jgi:hypothetical protein